MNDDSNAAPLAPDGAPPRFHGLTEREELIAVALAKGVTCREIATELGNSTKTVDGHRQRLLKKLGCRDTVALVYFMLRAGKVSL